MGVWGVSLFAGSAASAILTLGIACIMLAVGILLAAVLSGLQRRYFRNYCESLLIFVMIYSIGRKVR